MNKREACSWVHTHLIVEDMAFDELVSAFTVLAGHAPTSADRSSGLFRRCTEIVMSSTGVPAGHHPETNAHARKPCVK